MTNLALSMSVGIWHERLRAAAPVRGTVTDGATTTLDVAMVK